MDPFIKYYDPQCISTHEVSDYQEYEQLTSMNSRGLKVFHTNIRSIDRNVDELNIFLAGIKHDFDVIILTETFRLHSTGIYGKSGYDLFYNEGDINKNDGVLVYIKKIHQYTVNVCDVNRIKMLQVSMTYFGEKIKIFALYRPNPTCPRSFVDHLGGYMNGISADTDYHLLIGDVNIDILDKDEVSQSYLSTLYEFGFVSYINGFTRVFGASKSCIDHIFIKQKRPNKHTITPIIFKTNITDHYSTIVHFDFTKSSLLENTSKADHQADSFRSFIDYKRLKKDLSDESWTTYYTEDNIDMAANKLIQRVSEHIGNNTKKVKIRAHLKRRNEWITEGLIKSIQTKNRLYKEANKNPGNPVLVSQYKKYRNCLNMIIKRTKVAYYSSRIQQGRHSSKQLYDTVKKICKSAPKKRIISVIEKSDGALVKDKKEIADVFNEHYTKMGKKLADKIKTDKSFTHNIHRVQNTIFLNPVDEKEILGLINNLKLHKSPGIDNIRAEVLKQVAKEVIKPLTHLFNRVILEGNFPDIFKQGIIVPIFKKGDKTKAINYRPITLISAVGKVLETAIKNRLLGFFEKNRILSQSQYGFRSSLSAEDAVAGLTSSIYGSLNDKKKALCVFVDLAKAFDTVDHTILLDKLERCGVRGRAHDLFKSYLLNRRQIVRIDNTYSSPQTVECGVPQGTVLGPILFITYINDLLTSPSEGKILCFADDTAIYYEADDWEELKRKAEADLGAKCRWFANNLLTINFEKTRYLPFASYSSSLPNFNVLSVRQCGLHILSAESISYLGVILDNHLRWNFHIEKLIMKIRSLLPMFRNLRHLLNVTQLKTLYFSLVRSQLLYGILSWGSVAYCYLRKLEVMQKWILKVIYNRKITFPSDELYREAEVMDVGQLFVFKVLTWLYKNKHIIVYNKHSYDTRKKFSQKEKIKKNAGKLCYSYIALKLFDLLPEALRNINSIKKFSKATKVWIFQKTRQEVRKLIEGG